MNFLEMDLTSRGFLTFLMTVTVSLIILLLYLEINILIALGSSIILGVLIQYLDRKFIMKGKNE